VARTLLETGDHLLLIGPGAERYAQDRRFELIDNASLVVPREQARFDDLRSGRVQLRNPDPFRTRSFGTVGAVALDREGHLAAGTSTGGSLYKHPGRVGDSAIPGAGYFADDATAAISTTGWGEAILRVQLARHAADLVEAGAVGPEAAVRAIRQLEERAGGWGGLILIDRSGWIGFAHNSPRMAFAWRTPGSGPETRITADGESSSNRL
jgi:beta-aspartyl-peptidase (threonine type)